MFKMTSPIPALAMSEDAYFEMLEKSIDKYEYWNGVAVAMPGAQPDHLAIQGNIFGELFQQLRSRHCRPIGSDQAVKLAAGEGYVFPDLTVACGKSEYVTKRGLLGLLNPSVIVEVLSPSTAMRDETAKLLAYTGIRSVREYLVVWSERSIVKLYFRRSADETWGVRLFDALTDVVELDSCQCRLTPGEIYAGVSLMVGESFPLLPD
jgi:Uma2 family endonuclease